MVAGWFVANQQQMLSQAEADRIQAEARIAVLEDRLRVTDEVMSEAGADTKNELGRWESEIRKLWAVSNERNKGWIQGNQATLKKQASSLSDISSQQKQLASQLSAFDKKLDAQGGIRDDVASLGKRMDGLVETQRELVDRVNAARKTVASLQSGLANRVTENEQAVASMDSYRLQLNNRLAELERRLAGG
jgi:chromosome segregation ATPase